MNHDDNQNPPKWHDQTKYNNKVASERAVPSGYGAPIPNPLDRTPGETPITSAGGATGDCSGEGTEHLSPRHGTPGLEVIYSNSLRVAEVFWEWRHKVMTRFFAATAGILVAAGWLYRDSDLRGWTFCPLALGAVFSLISHRLDRINTLVLRSCYELGSQLEADLMEGEEGIFSRIRRIHHRQASYYGTMRIVYIGTAVVLFALGLVALVKFF